jgi:hypothetical protein
VILTATVLLHEKTISFFTHSDLMTTVSEMGG